MGGLRLTLQRVLVWALRPVLDGIAHQQETLKEGQEQLLGELGRVQAETSRAHDDLALVQRDLTASSERLAQVQRDLTASSEQLAQVQRDLTASSAQLARDLGASSEQLAGDQRALSAALGELQRHLEVRQDQAEGGQDALRAAVSAVQEGVMAISGGALPELQSRLARVDQETSGALGRLQGEVEILRDQRVPQLTIGQQGLHDDLAALLREVEGLRDERLPRVEQAGARLHDALAAVLVELETVRDRVVPRLGTRLDDAQQAIAAVQHLAEELRDARVPALAGRLDALVERLHEDLTALGGLVERLLAGAPLRVAAVEEVEVRLPEAMLAASRAFADAFRGSSEEIAGRVAEHLPRLRDHGPVLELGCGRGELLGLLQQNGIEAWGVDADPAMVAACRRFGLAVHEGDALSLLREQAPGSLGAVVAIHVLEHLPAAVWMGVVESAARALRPGGVLLVECPNPESLRVGALFWIDPTHRLPVHPEALAFVARAMGLHVDELTVAHEFPPEQRLARRGQGAEVHELAERLDAWLSAPRDFILVAHKTTSS